MVNESPNRQDDLMPVDTALGGHDPSPDQATESMKVDVEIVEESEEAKTTGPASLVQKGVQILPRLLTKLANHA
jgi:hypothetical protein